MHTLKFYKKLPYMECLAGDTLGPFRIEPESISTNGDVIAMDITGCKMQLILAASSRPADAIAIKECEIVEGGFEAILTSADTNALRGNYQLHFAMTNTDGNVYRKLCGELWVHPVAQGDAV